MIRATLPWPPKATSANGSQGKWRAKATAAKSYKDACAWLIRAAKVPPIDYAPIVIVTFCAPNRVSRYDLDNTLGRAKQGLDAMSEALGVDDGEWLEMRLRRGAKTRAGQIIVEVHRPDAMIEVRGTVS
jgi:crossover junction endodeoxyribonuclease RusA